MPWGIPTRPAIQTPRHAGDGRKINVWAALQLELILTGEGLAPDPEERRDILQDGAAYGRPDVPVAMRTLSLARTCSARNARLKVGLTPFCQGR